MKLAVVLVHYFTPQLAERACQALARDAASTDLELEMVLIDNGSRTEDREFLASLPARRVEAGGNLGYAGGANLGFAETRADLVVVMNPDVEVLPGCLRSLTEALMSGARAAGPRFFWDRDRRFQLPPTEAVGRLPELLRVLAGRGPRWARLARQRWRHHARRQWTAKAPLACYDLSGALLALRRSAWEEIGPFDEGYRLYFEETDWLQRLRHAGHPAQFIPAAEAVHLYAQSTAHEGEAANWFLESNRRFRERSYGRIVTRMLEKLAARQASVTQPMQAWQGSSDDLSGSPVSGPRASWLEVSPSPLGYPAAGWALGPDTTCPETVPDEILGRLAPGTYTLTTVDDRGRELGSKTFRH